MTSSSTRASSNTVETVSSSEPDFAPRSRRPGQFSPATGFWVVASTFLVAMAFSTVPTPLYTLYQSRDGFATVMITVIFAAYAVGVMAALYAVGHISDWLGRRPVLIVALFLEIAAALLFVFDPSIAGLLVGRVLTGLGVGMLTATATAHLGELSNVARAGVKGGASTTIAGIVNLGGIGLGPVIAGALAQYVAAPLVVPYAVFTVLMAAGVIAFWRVPETVVRPDPRPAYRPQRISLPSAARPVFWSAAVGAFSAFAIFGLFTSLAPAFVAGTLHVTNRLTGGAVVFAVFAAAAVAQLVAARLFARTQLVAAIVLMGSGLVVLAIGSVTASFAMFLIGGVVAGAGVGLMFRSSVGVAARIADPRHRGEVLAALFLVAYAGLALPVLAIGLAVVFVPMQVVLVLFAAVILVLVVVAGLRMIARSL